MLDALPHRLDDPQLHTPASPCARSLGRFSARPPRPCSGSVPSLLKEWPNDCYKCGPFASAQQFNDKAAHYAIKRAAEKPDIQRGPFPAMEEPVPLVFTHNDLNMGNILLGQDGLKLCISLTGTFLVSTLFTAESIGIEHNVWLNGAMQPWKD